MKAKWAWHRMRVPLCAADHSVAHPMQQRREEVAADHIASHLSTPPHRSTADRARGRSRLCWASLSSPPTRPLSLRAYVAVLHGGLRGSCGSVVDVGCEVQPAACLQVGEEGENQATATAHLHAYGAGVASEEGGEARALQVEGIEEEVAVLCRLVHRQVVVAGQVRQRGIERTRHRTTPLTPHRSKYPQQPHERAALEEMERSSAAPHWVGRG